MRYIGADAFEANDIKQIDIPKTVEFIWYDAFADNMRLIDWNRKITDKLKRLSKKTKLLHIGHWG